MKQILMAGILLLTGCNSTSDMPKEDSQQIVSQNIITTPMPRGVYVIIDPKTGCEYLTFYTNSITPRYEHGGNMSSGAATTKVRGCR